MFHLVVVMLFESLCGEGTIGDLKIIRTYPAVSAIPKSVEHEWIASNIEQAFQCGFLHQPSLAGIMDVAQNIEGGVQSQAGVVAVDDQIIALKVSIDIKVELGDVPLKWSTGFRDVDEVAFNGTAVMCCDVLVGEPKTVAVEVRNDPHGIEHLGHFEGDLESTA